ncbi:hypothetical protein Kpol_455p13 [Vanderwaltozyma polyspora DSM 70294]|uniref:OPT family small oligopeptide transporter n=1 Tax=Vanderwaltozyma polyspora (strain ATCC 22028 / DSM 70294 / BCRC 21397 / CBS 2163 / NBRC 10782 / NRRL Y-8283 / UCD 57-17) TaxID=436907 RepID=A7TR34_VANPO|nr:uncharacterized protein Kpol_455p13 [Vanderwaltozyma polyspora DSM 70294]EDO15282.1 hypothetical protein Kpol_455p13 [Vanderwaltozyma polyspora DSM 70294]
MAEKNDNKTQVYEMDDRGSNGLERTNISLEDDSNDSAEKKQHTKIHTVTEHSFDTAEGSYDEAQLEYVMKKMGYHKYEDLSDIPPTVAYIASKVSELPLEDAIEELRKAAEYHKDDPNIPSDEYEEIKYLSNPENIDIDDKKQCYEARILASMIKFHSPYKEVRAVVDPTDDPTIPVETFRSYLFALFWAIVGSGFNEFFSHRQVTISINTSVVQMFLYPSGLLWAKYVPCWGISIKGRKYAINIDKPWSQKEQMFSTLLFSICSGTFYTHYNILTQKVYYHDNVSFGYQFLLSLSIQFLGFGFAGILRKFVVYPTKALWPTSFPTIALNKALLSRKEENTNGMTRYKFFFLTFFAMFIYNWFPTYIINIFNTFNWMTWISPNNFNLAMITGGVSGIGFNPIASFDWNVASYINPLRIPFFSNMTQYCGAVFAALVVIAVYWTNYMDCQYLPLFSNTLYTNRATRYQVTEVLDSDWKLDNAKYQEYSAPYYSAGNLVAYGSFIATYPMLIVYSMLTETKLLWSAMKQWTLSLWSLTKKHTWTNLLTQESCALDEFDDPHSRMMKNYKEVPDWWYFVVLLAAIGVGIAVIEAYHTNTPVWSLFVSIGFNVAFLIPLTMLQATAGFSLGLNLLIEMIVGYALPGNPFALMIIKAFGYNIDGQADNYVSNLKMAHYTKIPPIALFRGQMIMVFLQIFVNLGVLNWQISNIKGFCTHDQKAKFTCPDATTYYNASVVWGALGPKKIFNDVYPILRWCWLIGACIGLFFGVWKRFGKFYPTWFNPILFVGGMINMAPPYGLMYFTPGIIVSYLSQYHFKKYHLRLWEKYNYILDAGFTSGLVLSAIIIFFAVQYEGTNFSWWGNNVPYAGLDGAGPPLKNISDTARGYFGPELGHLP